jgi:hypothetical protein
VKIAFPDPTELSPPIINVKDISFKYAEGLPTLFTKVDFGLDMQSRVSMVGPNGVGKSTLLSLILGKWLVVGGGFTVVVVVLEVVVLQWWWFYSGGGFRGGGFSVVSLVISVVISVVVSLVPVVVSMVVSMVVPLLVVLEWFRCLVPVVRLLSLLLSFAQ